MNERGPAEVELHVCPICHAIVEWQGNDYGYLCAGDAYGRHREATAEPVRGTFAASPATRDGVAIDWRFVLGMWAGSLVTVLMLAVIR